MRILCPLRPDIRGGLVEEFSTPAMAIAIGNAMTDQGVDVGYLGNVESTRVRPTNTMYAVDPGDPDWLQIARAMITYREERWDVLHLHTVSFSHFKNLYKYSGTDDRIVVTLHMPPNIGRSFYYHHQDLVELLRDRPNFRLICVSRTGSYEPLRNFFGTDSQGRPMLPSGWDKVRVIHNGVVHPRTLNIRPVPPQSKINRIMFVAHMVHNKNILKTLEIAVENQIQCLYVGRRFPYKNGKIPANEEEYAVACEKMIAANPGLIEHIPHLPYAECVRQMSLSRCMMIMSDLESFGLTPVEAGMVATPTIWLECQGIDDTMVDGLTGRRIRRQEYRTWKARKQRAVELYGAIHMVEPVSLMQHVAQFSVEATAQKYQELYREIM